MKSYTKYYVHNTMLYTQNGGVFILQINNVLQSYYTDTQFHYVKDSMRHEVPNHSTVHFYSNQFRAA